VGKERRGRRRGGEGKEDEGGEKEGLPPLEWRSGYAPANYSSRIVFCYIPTVFVGPTGNSAIRSADPENTVDQMALFLV